jgi:hypothetical protein
MPVLGNENQMRVRDRHAVPARAYVPVAIHLGTYREGVQLRYNYRVDPQPRHRIAFGKAFGCVRVVFNDGLAAREQVSRTSPMPSSRPG